MKFTAPDHITAITLSTGPVAVVDGTLTIDGDLLEGDRAALVQYGFTPLADEPAPALKAKPTPPPSDK
jgi:hypothetical protein